MTVEEIREALAEVDGRRMEGPGVVSIRVIVAAARTYVDLLDSAERIEATEKWFGTAKHPIPYMKPGQYLLLRLPVESVEP